MQKNVFQEKSSIGFLARTILLSFLFGLIITFVVSLAFGYKYKIVATPSMYPTLPVNALVIVAPIKYEDLKIGDIVTFGEPSGTTFTHRIHCIDEETQLFKTKGDNSDNIDGVLQKDRLVGKVVANFNFVGQLIRYVKSNLILFTFFVVIFMLVWLIFV